MLEAADDFIFLGRSSFGETAIGVKLNAGAGRLHLEFAAVIVVDRDLQVAHAMTGKLRQLVGAGGNVRSLFGAELANGAFGRQPEVAGPGAQSCISGCFR